MIREREKILKEIEENHRLREIFYGWGEEEREEFLDFCSGVKGVRILYDSFFKEIMNPEYAPDRLNDLLSYILGQNVKILSVLPNDSTRIADEHSLLIMDILVELVDGSLANIEVQKPGYMFGGQRAAGYSADLLLRQYKRVRDESDDRKKKFSYKDIKPVYTIVFFEKSPKKIHEFAKEQALAAHKNQSNSHSNAHNIIDIGSHDNSNHNTNSHSNHYEGSYIHRFEQKSDTGFEMNFLQKYILIGLDIFKSISQNEGIQNKTEAWLGFLSTDEPEKIIELIGVYPEFEKMYKDIDNMCLNVEKVMGMFSKELLELDRNTVDYMIDEMQNEISGLRDELSEKDKKLSEQDVMIQMLKKKLSTYEKSSEL